MAIFYRIYGYVIKHHKNKVKRLRKLTGGKYKTCDYCIMWITDSHGTLKNSKFDSPKLNHMQNRTAFPAIVSIFFFWGFMAASNGIFIPFCKNQFSLTQFQSQLIDATFYGGYFAGSVLLFIYTYLTKKDLIQQLGYAKSFAAGLMLSAMGAACMVPSLHSGNYSYILVSFFVIALGFSMQQTAANPLVIMLGDERTGAHRLNLAGGINSLGTTLGPLIVAYFLFGNLNSATSVASMDNVATLYIILSVLFILLAVLLSRIQLAANTKAAEDTSFSFEALKYPQLYMGMIAIFIYVGVEVTIQSNLGKLLEEAEYGSWTTGKIAPLISLYWGSLMIGRWTAASEAITPSARFRKWLIIILPVVAYTLVYAFSLIKSAGDTEIIHTLFLPYALMVALMIAVAYFTIENAAHMLLSFSLAAVLCTTAALLTGGQLSLLLFISGGLWCSVMWPCIFAIAINNLGRYTSQASAFLIMMILGGAVIPPLQGYIADTIHIKTSYIIAPVCFAYLAFYAWRFRHMAGTKQLH
jgi:FHS family L-fucose permease-like MFS transporter